MKKERLRMNVNPDCEAMRHIEGLLRRILKDNMLLHEENKMLQRELERIVGYSSTPSKIVPRVDSSSESK